MTRYRIMCSQIIKDERVLHVQIAGFCLFMGIAIAILILGLVNDTGVPLVFWVFLTIANLFTWWGTRRLNRRKKARLAEMSEAVTQQTKSLEKMLATLDKAGKRRS